MRILLGSFRRGEATDPEVYVPALAAMLASYPENIVRQVTDPVRDIASKQNFLPTLAELRHECEELMRPMREEQRRAARERETQKLLAAPLVTATVEERDRAIKEWFERIRPTMGAGRTGAKVLSDDQARQEAEQQLERLAGHPLPPLSDAAKKRRE